MVGLVTLNVVRDVAPDPVLPPEPPPVVADVAPVEPPPVDVAPAAPPP
jgi:hypothetical protein